MQTRKLLITAAACLLLAAGLQAITRQWSVPAGQAAFVVTADGKGGCAFLSFETNTAITVTWVDRKGAVKYQKESAVGTIPTLIKCTRKVLVYSLTTSNVTTFVRVDKKGEETAGGDPGKLQQVIGQRRSIDKKGFFVVNIDTNPQPNRSEVVRYTDK
jgi:hypothetical protein